MKDLQWTKYGIETEHSRSAYQGEDKMFKVEKEHIYFNTNLKFVMGIENFIACCYNVKSIPISPESDSDQIYVGEDGGYQVYMERVTDHDIGDQEQVGITLRNHGKWYSWIRFTLQELLNIAEALKATYSEEELREMANRNMEQKLSTMSNAANEKASDTVSAQTNTNVKSQPTQNTLDSSKQNIDPSSVSKAIMDIKIQLQNIEKLLAQSTQTK